MAPSSLPGAVPQVQAQVPDYSYRLAAPDAHAGQPAVPTPIQGAASGAAPAGDWEGDLAREADALLQSGSTEVWDVLSRRFESQLIKSALAATHGRRMEAAQRLGIGRNTITRKIQELGLSASDD